MRQLLALFALLSGLAAIGVPETASAGPVENALTELAEQAAKVDCEVVRSGSIDVCKQTLRKDKNETERAKRKVTIVVPSFQMKADRALE